MKGALFLVLLVLQISQASPLSFLLRPEEGGSGFLAKGAVAYTSNGHSFPLSSAEEVLPKWLAMAPEFEVTLDAREKMAWFQSPQEDLSKVEGVVAGVLKREKNIWKILQLNFSCSSDCDLILPQKKASFELTAMSFNLRYGTANDGKNSWYNRDHLVFKIFTDYKPMIVGVQEALLFQLEEITENIPGYKWFGVGRDDGQEAGEYSAVFYQPETLQLLEQGTFWYCDTPSVPGCTSYGNTLPRICTWGRFRHLPTGRSFHFYNTHLDHQSSISREKSSRQLTSHIQARGMQEPFMVTGDFNNPLETSAEIQILKDFGFDDSFRVLFPNATEVGTFNGFTGNKSGSKIDFVFTPRDSAIGGKASLLKALIIHDHENGSYPSDHFPVYAQFVLP